MSHYTLSQIVYPAAPEVRLNAQDSKSVNVTARSTVKDTGGNILTFEDAIEAGQWLRDALAQVEKL